MNRSNEVGSLRVAEAIGLLIGLGALVVASYFYFQNIASDQPTVEVPDVTTTTSLPPGSISEPAQPSGINQ